MTLTEYVKVYQALLTAGDAAKLRIDSLEHLTLDTVFQFEESILWTTISTKEIIDSIQTMSDVVFDLGFQLTKENHSINVLDDLLIDFYNSTVGLINGWSVSYEEYNQKTVLVYEMMSGEKVIGTIEGVFDGLSRMASNLRDIGYFFSLIEA